MDSAREKEFVENMPEDAVQAFAYLVSRCASGLYQELIDGGKTDTQARNLVIGCFLDFAAGEACRIARRENREPDPKKWGKAVTGAFERAVKRTAPSSGKEKNPARRNRKPAPPSPPAER